MEDRSDDNKTVEIEKLCPWLFFDNSSLKLYGTPMVKDVFVLHLQISDQDASTEAVFNITVLNEPPVPAGLLPNITIDVKQKFFYQIPYLSLFTDPDGDEITIDVKLYEGGLLRPLPSWISYDPDSHCLAGEITKQHHISFDYIPA